MSPYSSIVHTEKMDIHKYRPELVTVNSYSTLISSVSDKYPGIFW